MRGSVGMGQGTWGERTAYDSRFHPSLLQCYPEGSSLGRTEDRLFSSFYISWRISKETNNLKWATTLLNHREEMVCNGPVVVMITSKCLVTFLTAVTKDQSKVT